jgi:hypothetical protein
MPSEESAPSTSHCRTAEGFRLGSGALSDQLDRLASDGGKPILKAQYPAQLLAPRQPREGATIRKNSLFNLANPGPSKGHS